MDQYWKAFWKNGSQWVRDQNMLDVAKSHKPSQWASTVSSWLNIVMKQNYDQSWKVNALLNFWCSWLGAYNLQNQILKEVIEN